MPVGEYNKQYLIKESLKRIPGAQNGYGYGVFPDDLEMVLRRLTCNGLQTSNVYVPAEMKASFMTKQYKSGVCPI